MTTEGLLSIKPVVEFLNIEEYYTFEEDLTCTYKFNDYRPKEGDRIGIFKLAWTLVKDYIVFEWVSQNPPSLHLHTVTFNKHILPRNSTDLYQICYISGENELKAATSTFQFVANVNIVSVAKPKIERKFVIGGPSTIHESSNEINKLKEENELLRESLKAILVKKDAEKPNDKQIAILTETVNDLKNLVSGLQKDVNMLKHKIVEGGEEYKKLYLEKASVEKKFDKLKQQVKRGERVISKDMINSFDINELKSIPPFPL